MKRVHSHSIALELLDLQLPPDNLEIVSELAKSLIMNRIALNPCFTCTFPEGPHAKLVRICPHMIFTPPCAIMSYIIVEWKKNVARVRRKDYLFVMIVHGIIDDINNNLLATRMEECFWFLDQYR